MSTAEDFEAFTTFENTAEETLSIMKIQNELNRDPESTGRVAYTYKLGEDIANGVRFFGQQKTDKDHSVTAMCVCPLCGELWRVRLTAVRFGAAKSCCKGTR